MCSCVIDCSGKFTTNKRFKLKEQLDQQFQSSNFFNLKTKINNI